MKSVLKSSATTDPNGRQRMKKQKSKRDRNAIRSALQSKLIEAGEYQKITSNSSSSTESGDSNDLDDKYIQPVSTGNSACLKKIYFPRTQHSLGKRPRPSDESEAFIGFPISSNKTSQGTMTTHHVKSANRTKFSSTSSLTDNYVTSAGQNCAIPCTYSSSSEGKACQTNNLVSKASNNGHVEKENGHAKCNGGAMKEAIRILEEKEVSKEAVNVTDKWLKQSNDLNKEMVENELLKSYVIKSNIGFEDHGSHRCMACKDRFLLDTGLEDHLKRVTIEIDFNCEYCNANLKFFNRCSLLHHIQEHSIEPTAEYLQKFTVRKPMILPEYFVFEYGSLTDEEDDIITLSSKDDETASSGCSTPSTPTTLRPSSEDLESLDEIEESVLPSQLMNVETVTRTKPNARSDDGLHKCLKCTDYSTNNEEEFYSHIKSTHIWSKEEIQQLFHKNGDRSEFWCPECNDTFVTKLSLTMHLKVAHEFLQDTSTYLEKLGYEGKIPLFENQCEVCFLMLNEPFGLQKHMRTHGLAFLRLQKRQRLQDIK